MTPGAPGVRKVSRIERLPALAAALEASPLSCVDVGARGGAFPPLRLLAPWIHYCAFEPDPGEAERLAMRMARSGWRRVTVVPKALAGHAGAVDMFLTEHEGFASMLRPDLAVGGHFCQAEGFAARATLRVPATTLEEAAAEYGFTDASFVKLDTQGTEMEILAAGEQVLDRAVLGLYVEVLLQPFYVGQPTAGTLLDYLFHRGFALIDLQRTFLRRAGHDPTLFSRRQVVWAHALLMREPGHPLVRTGAGALARYVGLAVAFDQFDLALEAIRSAGTSGCVAAEQAERLADDVVSLARERTREVLEQLPKAVGAPEVLACALKDRRSGPQ